MTESGHSSIALIIADMPSPRVYRAWEYGSAALIICLESRCRITAGLPLIAYLSP
jgi:hypothetical protein